MTSLAQWLCGLALVSSGMSTQLSLDNGIVRATIDSSKGLVGLSELGPNGGSLSFAADSWTIQVGDYSYSPVKKPPTTTTTTVWIAHQGYSCSNHPTMPGGHVTTASSDDCSAICKRQLKGCVEWSWRHFDQQCWMYASTGAPKPNSQYDCGWSLAPPAPLPHQYCKAAAFGSTGLGTASLNYTCGDVEVLVAYSLRPGAAFVEKRLSIATQDDTFAFKGANLFDDIQFILNSEDVAGAPTWHDQENPFTGAHSIAGFVRWDVAARGAFISVGNPWGRYMTSKSKTTFAVSAFYEGHYNHSAKLQGKWFQTEPAMIGLTSLGKYKNEGLNTGERVAFQRCVENYLLDHEARQNKTVKIMVAWDANDYQIDAGTEDGRTEYKRIIDRASEFGITHIVYEPRNTLHGSRFNTTDGWGWEEALWLGMGELIREGKWDPRDDSIPQDIMGQLKYASDRNVKLVAYAYPMLPFEKVKKYFVNSEMPNALSLAPPEVQTYLIDIMTAFVKKAGIGGFAWDHDIFAGNTTAQKDELKYAQWRGWMNICGALRERFPDIVMDHRQTAHRWGPWYQLAGSYAEPIAGDENPESYGVPIPSLHTDHVAGDNTRKINYIYSTQGLLPPARIPGFMFHQSERTDDDGHHYCTKKEVLCVNNSNTRDFDLLGYKYSVLSTIGTAGLNNVVTMIPARDVAEFTHFPQEDILFIKKWLAWTDSNIDKLRNTQWIPTLNGPQAGSVDGTHAMSKDDGFVFLFNPNMEQRKVKLTVDESLGLTGGPGTAWNIVELYPRDGASVATWKYGEKVDVSLLGSDVRVLGLTKTSGATRSPHLMHATMLSADINDASSDLELKAVSGPAGQEVIVAAHLGEARDSPTLARVSVNGVHCGITSGPQTEVAVQFAGEPVLRVMPVSPTRPPAHFAGGWFNTSFVIPTAVKQQLKERDIKYPVPWSYTNASGSCGLPHCVDDSKATWLIPSRLLLNPFLMNRTADMILSLFIDGKKVEVKKAFNSRDAPKKSHTAGAGGHETFLGFYYDASDVTPNVTHKIALHLPRIEEGSFQGLFWENVETQYTSEVSSCRLLSEKSASVVYV